MDQFDEFRKRVCVSSPSSDELCHGEVSRLFRRQSLRSAALFAIRAGEVTVWGARPGGTLALLPSAVKRFLRLFSEVAKLEMPRKLLENNAAHIRPASEV